jgi:peroxiredoxin
VSRVITQGSPVPQVALSQLVDGKVQPVQLVDLLLGKRAVIVGVVGAHLPICSESHAPDFVRRAGDLRKMGYDQILCVVPNDPWTVATWSAALDPENRVRFLSDGNLEFAKRLGVTFEGRDFFVGERPRRYLLLCRGSYIERISVEPNPAVLTCTRPDDIRLAA